jgi:hypothetical protein
VGRRAAMKLDRTVAGVTRWLWKWLGWVILVVVATQWNSLTLMWLFILSVTAILYFAFRVPTWCGAETRQGKSCRRNAHGLLMGCSYRQHKWQKFSLAAKRRRWKRLGRELWSENKVGSVGLIISGLALVATAVSAAANVFD